MTKYQLAKLVDWAGGIDTRKRMQKLVYMLQAAGCNFYADYFLHRYGPYSQDVAQLTDDMVSIGVLEESSQPNQVGQQYSYQLTEQGRQQLVRLEGNSKFADLVDQLSKYEALANELANKDLRELEVASTIAYYHHDKKLDWEEAAEHAFSFKGVNDNTTFATKTIALAKKADQS